MTRTKSTDWCDAGGAVWNGRETDGMRCPGGARAAGPRRRTALRLAAAVAVVAMLGATRAAHAQGGAIDAQCRAGTASERMTQDACQKAIDLLQFMAPQLGATLTGGNAVLGEHSSLRGPGHFSLGLKANALQSALPRVDEHTPSLTGAQADDYTVRKQWIAAPVLDAAIGIFRGIPFAGTYALGVDALVNVAYIPSVNEGDFSLDAPDGSLKFGYGARLGLLAETFVTPGISVTWLQRDLPTVNVQGRVSGDALDVQNVRVSTTAWRVVAGKNLSGFGLAGGGGQDHDATRADVQVTVNQMPAVMSNVIAARQDLTRNNIFASIALNLPALRVIGEVGRASGGSLKTYNSFAGHRADDARSYASLGLRVNW